MLQNKLLLIITLTLTTSCSSVSVVKCYNSVQSEYPNSIIFPIPNNPYQFIVCDSDKVYYVETMSWKNSNITDVIIVK